LLERGQIANPITLKNLFDQDGALSEIGGAVYLARLAEAAVTIINAEHYGRTIHDLYLRRELITIGQDVVTDASRHAPDDLAAAQAWRPAHGPDGRIDLNKPAEDGAVVGFFSLEMSAEQLATRILAEESGTSSDRIRRGEVRREDFDKFVMAAQRLAALPLY